MRKALPYQVMKQWYVLYVSLHSFDVTMYCEYMTTVFFHPRVTSFIGQVLHRALASEWNEELFIEVDLINKITAWVTAQQHDDGYFVETADVIYSRDMNVRLPGWGPMRTNGLLY